jgi:hypothetical protein
MDQPSPLPSPASGRGRRSLPRKGGGEGCPRQTAPPARWRSAACPGRSGRRSSATSSTSGSAKVCSRPFVVVGLHRIVQRLALRLGQFHAGAHAVGAPAVLAVVGEQARVQLGVARWRTPGRRAGWRRPAAGRCPPWARRPPSPRAGHPDGSAHGPRPCRAPARGPAVAQQGLVGGCDVQAQHRQLDGVFLEAVDARKAGGGQEMAVHRRWV